MTERIFVDTNVFMYAVGADHPHRAPAQDWLVEAQEGEQALFVSSEVLQELMHVYLTRRRPDLLDDSLAIIGGMGIEVWRVDATDVLLARELARRHPALSARDLLHRSCCERRQVHRIKTFDETLAAAFPERA